MSEQPNLGNLPEFSITVEKLPSKSLAYPEHCSIKYRTYAYGEIVKVNASTFQTKEALIIMTLGIQCSFFKNDLTLSDAIYLGLMRKISTLGTEKLKLPYLCKNCRQKYTHVFKNQDLEFNDIDVSELPLRFELNSTNKSYELWPLTLGKYLKLVDEGKAQDEMALKSSLCINLPFEEVYKDFSECKDFEDMEVLTLVDDMLDHGLKNITATCTNKFEDGICGHKTKLSVEGRQHLLLPFRKCEQSIRSRISFGKTPEHKSDRPGSDGLPQSKAAQ